MAPNGWHVSDWRRVRLQPYIVLFKDVFVYRGDSARIGSDLKLGHLRDPLRRPVRHARARSVDDRFLWSRAGAVFDDRAAAPALISIARIDASLALKHPPS
jgi:hypothetical protein